MARTTTGLVTVFGVFALCGLRPAEANERPEIRYSQRYEACSAKAKGSYTHILACMAEEQRYQAVFLNREFGAVMRRLSEPNRKKLLRLQHAWLAGRKQVCPLLADAGTSDLVDQRLCFLEETVRRTDWLKRQ